MENNQISDLVPVLAKSWELVLSQYKSFAETNSKNEGPGINIFIMLTTKKANGSNCNYYYAERDGSFWKDFVGMSPYSEKINKIYDPSKIYCICVGLQYEDNSGPGSDPKSVSSFQNIRLFEFGTGNEIDLS